MKDFFKRLSGSTTFRITIIMLALMVLLGWGFSKTSTYVVKSVSNANRCIRMSKIVNRDIDEHLEKVENLMKASALTATSKRLTPNNSKQICDSIRGMADFDSVYVSSYHIGQKVVDDAIRKARLSNETAWSEPHAKKLNGFREKAEYGASHGVDSEPLVTLVVPLQDRRGRTYAMLCADMNMNWLRKIADRENKTENSEIKVIANDGIIIEANDPTEMMTEMPRGQHLKMMSDEITEMSVQNMFSGKGDGIAIRDSLAEVNSFIPRTGWLVKCSVPMRDGSELATTIMIIAYVMLFVLFGLITLAIFLVLKWQLHPLHKIIAAADAVSHGDFDAELPEVGGSTEIGNLRKSFARMQRALKTYIAELKETTETKVSMERDLDIASKIQIGMLPNEFPHRKDLDMFGTQLAAKTVGGDIFDYILQENKLVFCIGDVSGKGVPAALFMSAVGYLFRNVARFVNHPEKVCRAINDGLSEKNDENMFCTLFVGVLDVSTGRLNYCNAGHNAPIIITKGKDGSHAKFLETKVAMPCGAMAETVYVEEHIQLTKDDTLFLYTDGVTEAENKDKVLFGDEKALSTVETCPGSTSQELIEYMVETIQEYEKETEQSDDITMLSIRLPKVGA